MGIELSKLTREFLERCRRDDPKAFEPVRARPRQSAEPVQRSEGEDRRMETPENRFSYHITLTQHRRRLLDGHDSLAFSLKPTVDFITSWLGFKSDSDPRLAWEYHQVQTKGMEGVHILIEEKL